MLGLALLVGLNILTGYLWYYRAELKNKEIPF